MGKYDRTKDDYKVINFEANEDLAGFYGLIGKDAIRTLGFLIKDRDCVIEKLGAEALEGLSPHEDDDSNNGIVIVIIIFVLIVVVAVFIIVFIACQRSKKTSRVQSMPVQEKGDIMANTANISHNSVPEGTTDAKDGGKVVLTTIADENAGIKDTERPFNKNGIDEI